MKHLIKSIRYLLTLVHNDSTETIKSFETIDNAMSTVAHLTGIQLLNYMPTEIKGDTNGDAYFWNWGAINQWKITLEKIEEGEQLPRIQRKYFNFENQKTIDLLPFSITTFEKIRLERECMEKEIHGSIMNHGEISHYLVNGFTITTYQADYVIEGAEFSYDE